MSTVKLSPEKWVDRYADYLYNYTIVRVNDHEMAQDLVSETFLAGLRSMANFKGAASERTWLVAILKRKIIDYYRKKNSFKGQAEISMTQTTNSEGTKIDWLEEQVEDTGTKNIEERLENIELRRAIEKCLESINEKQATIFRMKTMEEMDTEAICKEMDITPSNLWVLIHRARKAMAECLETKWLN